MSVMSTAIWLKLSLLLSPLTPSMRKMRNFDFTINGVASKFDSAAGDVCRPIDAETLEIMQYPKYRDAPPYINDMHGDEKVIINRMKNISLMQKYATDIQKSQADDEVFVLCPCNWCGMPTGDWCEGCLERSPDSPASHTICVSCERYWIYCRLCRLEMQVGITARRTDSMNESDSTSSAVSGNANDERTNASTHRVAHGAWKGTTECHWCDFQSLKLRQCTACGIGRYCGQRCQRKDWQKHKHFLSIFPAKATVTNCVSMVRRTCITSNRGLSRIVPTGTEIQVGAPSC